MLVEINEQNPLQLYTYWCKVYKQVPYYFETDYKSWIQSMFYEKDIDEETVLFTELSTFVAKDGDNIKGFIQFGKPSFVFDENGNKTKDHDNGIIRLLYFDKGNESIGDLLIQKALDYFNKKNLYTKNSFYHYFGLSCMARHGKLHSSQFFIQDLLEKYGFKKVHENVYYSKIIKEQDIFELPGDMKIVINNISECRKRINFLKNDQVVGESIVSFLQDNSCYLYWIFIYDNNRNSGQGTVFIKAIFNYLNENGILRFDTDTAENNIGAQNFYLKNGFKDMGRTRSYE